MLGDRQVEFKPSQGACHNQQGIQLLLGRPEVCMDWANEEMVVGLELTLASPLSCLRRLVHVL